MVMGMIEEPSTGVGSGHGVAVLLGFIIHCAEHLDVLFLGFDDDRVLLSCEEIESAIIYTRFKSQLWRKETRKLEHYDRVAF